MDVFYCQRRDVGSDIHRFRSCTTYFYNHASGLSFKSSGTLGIVNRVREFERITVAGSENSGQQAARLARG
jgi:hypothetical protein